MSSDGGGSRQPSPPPWNNATILIVLMGRSSAGGPIAHESLVSRLLKPLSADLALVLGSPDDRPEIDAPILYRNARFVWKPSLGSSPMAWTALANQLAPGWAGTLRLGDSYFGCCTRNSRTATR